MRLNKTSFYSTVILDESIQKVPTKVQVLRVGKFNHPTYGYFEITKQTLAEMKMNFDNKIRGIDISFDYYHESNEDASAWVKNINLEEDGTELWADVDWTPKATQKLADRELRYFSPDFAFEWTDPENGKKYSNVLFGGGLTNRPFVKEMQAIVANEINKGENYMNELEKALAQVKDLETKNVQLTEEKGQLEKQLAEMPKKDKVAELEAQIAALQAELQKAKQEAEVALSCKTKLEEEKKMAEKESAFNILLSEGKVCVAQKEAYLKDNMPEFIKLAQPINLKGNGDSTNPNQVVDKTEQILKLAEEKQKANPKLSRGDAISLAKKEIEK